MRAFLREPSTPWIVFDQEGRPPSQLAVGEVLPVALSSVIPEHGFFPATAIIDAAPSAVDATPACDVRAEPSSLAVASDLDVEVSDADAANDADDVAPTDMLPGLGLGRRALGIAAVALAIVSTLGVGAFALRGGETLDVRAPNALAGRAARATAGAATPAEAASPSLESASRGGVVLAAASQPTAVTATPAQAAAVAPAPHVAVTAAAAAPAAALAAAAPSAFEIRKLPGTANHKFSRLSIAAGSRDVFLDGRRLLGRGARSFTVTCGAHSIAVGARTDARDVDVPCNSEIVLGK